MVWIGGKQIGLRDVDFAVTTRNATVAVQSLDEKNIGEVPRNPDIPGREIGSEIGEPIAVLFRARHRAPDYPRKRRLKLYKLRGGASEQREDPVSYESGRYQISLHR